MSTATAWTRSSRAPDPSAALTFSCSRSAAARVTGLASFYAYDPTFPGGVFVACGDVTGDGLAEVITGAGPGGGPHVRAFSFAGGVVTEVASFFAYDPAFPGGVTVAAADLTGDGVAEIITGAGPGGGPHVRAFSLAGGTPDGGRELLRLRPGVPGRRQRGGRGSDGRWRGRDHHRGRARRRAARARLQPRGRHR